MSVRVKIIVELDQNGEDNIVLTRSTSVTALRETPASAAWRQLDLAIADARHWLNGRRPGFPGDV